MDQTKVFDVLDRKIEKLLARLGSLEQENERLKAEVTAARRAEKDAADSKGAVERLERTTRPCASASRSSSPRSRPTEGRKG